MKSHQPVFCAFFIGFPDCKTTNYALTLRFWGNTILYRMTSTVFFKKYYNKKQILIFAENLLSLLFDLTTINSRFIAEI